MKYVFWRLPHWLHVVVRVLTGRRLKATVVGGRFYGGRWVRWPR